MAVPANPLLDLVAKGIPLKGDEAYWPLVFLTVFPPFGMAGMNNIAMGQTAMAFVKVASAVLSCILMVIFAPYLPLAFQGEWMFWITTIGPWYLFDIIQIFNRGQFEKDGFKPIIDLTWTPTISNILSPPMASGGGWTLTLGLLASLSATIGVSGQFITAYFPSEVGTKIGNWTSYIGLAGIGVAGAAAMYSNYRGSVPMSGGGASLPPLSSFIEKIPPPQSGGSRSSDAAPLFLYGLGFVAVSGIALGLVRK
jgi:hypothetical protein